MGEEEDAYSEEVEFVHFEFGGWRLRVIEELF